MSLISMVTITCVYINTCHKLVHQYTKSIKEDAQNRQDSNLDQSLFEYTYH